MRLGKDFKPGDQIVIVVSGEEIGVRYIITTIDQYGVQRLPCNQTYDDLHTARLVDLNDLVVAYKTGRLSFKSYFDYYTNIGLSVGGFVEIEDFSKLDVYNPIWEEESAA